MARAHDVIVIGAGLNGLTAAFHLAKAGRSVLVLEQRGQVGGSAVTEDLAPGFRFDPCIANAGWIAPSLIRGLDLQRHGLNLLPPDTTLAGLGGSAGALVLHRDQQKSIDAIETFSRDDARQWPDFTRRMHRLAGFLGMLYESSPPRPIGGGLGDLLSMAKLSGKLRALGKADMVELLRVLPMSIAELLDDEFESDLLKATIGAGGVAGLFQGPRSAGTTFVLLHHHVGGEAGTFRMRQHIRGGIGSLANALASAARAAGAEIRLGTCVQSISVARGRATGVVLNSGEEVAARVVLSSTDVQTTLLDLAGAAHLDPEVVRAVQNVRSRGVIARVHLALGELPHFTQLHADAAALQGTISIAGDLDTIERAYDDAKHGSVSRTPLLEVGIPSISDTGVAPPGQHVMSITMQYAPFALRNGHWDEQARIALGDAVVSMIAQHAPNVPGAILHRHVLTPVDIADVYHQPEGSVDHAELGLDQILFMRPLAGYSRYQSPIDGLFLGGAGCHPGRAIAGGAGSLAARAILNPAA